MLGGLCMWNINSLAQQLSMQQMSSSKSLFYGFVSIMLSCLCCMPHTLLPLLYYTFFSIIQWYLAKQNIPDELSITVYHENDTFFAGIIIALLIIGILWCYSAHKKSDFIKHYIVLNVPLTMRMAAITIFFFIVIMGIISGFFIYKFLILEQTVLPKPNFNPIKLIFKPLKLLPFVKSALKQINTFFKAQALFDQINATSFVLYYASQIVAIIELVWYFSTMRKALRSINQ